MYSMSSIRFKLLSVIKLRHDNVMLILHTQKRNFKNVYLDMNHHSSILPKNIIETSIYFLFLHQIFRIVNHE